MATANPVLAQSLTKSFGGSSLLKNVTLAVLGSLAIWISAKIQVPFYPVPMTMQVFVILAIGAAFGSRLGLATVLLYLAEGAAGLPVFAGTPEKGIGLVYMMQGTGGYLAGFLLAAIIVGWLGERGFSRNIFLAAIAVVIGLAAIYIPGLAWLAVLFGWEKPILSLGFWPFIGADLLKAALAALLVPASWHLFQRQA